MYDFLWFSSLVLLVKHTKLTNLEIVVVHHWGKCKAKILSIPVSLKKWFQAVVVHTFNPSTQEGEAVCICKFEAHLVYRSNSRIARAILRISKTKNQNPKSKTQNQKPKNTKPKQTRKTKQNKTRKKQKTWINIWDPFC